ncbi:purine-nucleoside phosphorylase [Paenibacillus turicensis]|jgi:purine-nucleoside phosphorylase|uniref:Purine nucleoside phosphorylase DeoD-type n=1 Tax=Paenibacillus turicensis TaxID=160487 RepID=A0ABS4FQ24_9BACL|nr:purine-nucleoside phosphorylase [Paenibacillus turicensis]MBP1904687.1 purine-nucleoside phosphorylase [Paenibacillus turicensis]
MSVHIGATQGQIADTILLPGDPLRAKYIAETYLEDVTCYNQVRGMLGFTGTYQGKQISVQGTGMGIPSISIYVNELISEYKVKNLIRVGTCGGMQKDVHVRDVILAQASCTDSSMNQHIFGGFDYAPIANFSLLKAAYDEGTARGLKLQVGNVFSSDMFYRDDKTYVQKLMDYGVLGVEMETTALYTLAAKFGVHALAILTVSDHLITGEETTAEERQTSFNDMIQMALATAASL